MSLHTTEYSNVTIADRLRGLFESFERRLEVYSDRVTRIDRIRALEAKSDEELEKLGIQRDGIVAHVFRDRFYV